MTKPKIKNYGAKPTKNKKLEDEYVIIENIEIKNN